MKEQNTWAVEMLEDQMDGMVIEDKMEFLENVFEQGCASGIIPGVIYFDDTRKIFLEWMPEILEEVEDFTHENGFEYFAGEMDRFDNYAVWLTVEQVAYRMWENLGAEYETEGVGSQLDTLESNGMKQSDFI